MLEFLQGTRDHLPPHYYVALEDLRTNRVSKQDLIDFLQNLPLTITLPDAKHESDDGVIIAHAGVDPDAPRKDNISWNVYGNSGILVECEDSTGMGDGLEPERWWDTYDSHGFKDIPFIVYGHLSQGPPHGHNPRKRNYSIGIDTCACSGGPLTAYSPDTGAIITYQSGINHADIIKGKVREGGKTALMNLRARLIGDW